MIIPGTQTPRTMVQRSRTARNLITTTGALLTLPAAVFSLMAAAHPTEVSMLAAVCTLAVLAASIPGFACLRAIRRGPAGDQHRSPDYLPLWSEALKLALAMVWISLAPVAAAAPLAAQGGLALAVYELLLVPAAVIFQLLLGALLVLSRMQVVE